MVDLTISVTLSNFFGSINCNAKVARGPINHSWSKFGDIFSQP